jgi:hypothetical protein
MSKKQQQPRFRDIWVNQTELGRQFGISAVAVGKKLSEFGLRDEQKGPSELARTEGYCHYAPMRDGTPFYLWNKEKVDMLLCQSGMSQLSKEEVEARSTAIELIALNRKADETGMDKFLCFFVDEIPRCAYPLIDRFLRELGSPLRLGTEEPELVLPSPPKRKGMPHKSEEGEPKEG